jgi:hypothetical protein
MPRREARLPDGQGLPSLLGLFISRNEFLKFLLGIIFEPSSIYFNTQTKANVSNRKQTEPAHGFGL